MRCEGKRTENPLNAIRTTKRKDVTCKLCIPQPKFRIGDMVMHEGKKYMVSGTVGWIHKGGAISVRDAWGGLELLTRVERCKLLKRRESIKKFWLELPEDK